MFQSEPNIRLEGVLGIESNATDWMDAYAESIYAAASLALR